MPLITQTASTFSYLTGKPPVPRPPIVFPKDCIVPYYSSTSLVSADWVVYTAGNGRYITGTTSSSLVGTTSSATSATVDVSLFSTGAHTGSVAYTSAASTATGSNINNGTNSSAGSHSHSGSIPFNVRPEAANVILLRANKNVSTIPANTIAFRRTLTGSYGTPFTQTGGSLATAYFMPNNSGGTITSASGSLNGSSSVSSSGSHRHHSNTNQYFINGRQTNRPLMDSGTHQHSISCTLSQTIMNTTIILDAWISAADRVPNTDVVVMYVGNPADLPTGWFLCNGSNGTVNMNSYYLGLGSSSWGTIRGSDASISTVGVGSIGQHSHISSAPAAGAGITGWHGSQSWDHTHTVSSTITPFAGARIFLYFIQYKG
jgi:hypothetical protein